jgi:hypothetical protein
VPLGSMRELSMEELSAERESAARASPPTCPYLGPAWAVGSSHGWSRVHTHPEGVYVGKNYGIYLVRLACVLSLG